MSAGCVNREQFANTSPHHLTKIYIFLFLAYISSENLTLANYHNDNGAHMKKTIRRRSHSCGSYYVEHINGMQVEII